MIFPIVWAIVELDKEQGVKMQLLEDFHANPMQTTKETNLCHLFSILQKSFFSSTTILMQFPLSNIRLTNYLDDKTHLWAIVEEKKTAKECSSFLFCCNFLQLQLTWHSYQNIYSLDQDKRTHYQSFNYLFQTSD